MVLTYIENLRRRPKAVRKRYAMFFTVGITFFIVCVYFFTMYLGALGTRPWKQARDSEVLKQTSNTELFNNANVFFEDTKNGNESAGDSWVEQFRKMNEEFLNEQQIQEIEKGETEIVNP